jgi:GNAT superfamily N-acetyltransferase
MTGIEDLSITWPSLPASANALGRTLMEEVEQRLLALGCPKVNVLVRTTNASVLSFYEKLGYARDDAFSSGKRLIPDI